ncbi:hypothetical protein ASPZODRAFT_63500 [Penicilliopsis zonata CBS 506.65]|uniref:FAD-binding PCMH-type domain-containing protein n=1 Tax=Penicilliopsis zonata CBS 506.65 TaxID=1073090 RepID=A0A1L9SLI2_9EURO|nr:hypothetical protein ASPZODRAFT_63500 [Penicilliopsis zonata CBS 506.65]OJJ48038.1 hypothetical protein ASPZODRAFT_63500 [Penicilliopsis zonata CBS 506.65]
MALLLTVLFPLVSASVSRSVPIAAQTVSSSSPAGVALFPGEAVQLTAAVLSTLSAELGEEDASLFSFGNTSVSVEERKCKLLPGDADWPDDKLWETFDALLGGALIRTVPLAAACYASWPEYNAAECDYVNANWTDSFMHASSPSSIMWPLFEGRTCLPTEYGDSCTLGGYSSYAVNVTTIAQIQLAVNFARNRGLRLVVKNTGHDFNGKSTGKGALGIWTHNMKDMEYLSEYQLDSYSGPAVKMGAGIQAFEIYEQSKQYNFTAVGGEGESVGVAGGYLLGGGHSPMSSVYGLAADQVLAMEVVLANGSFTTVTHASDPDLFWALRGGGGSTYGIVTSVISRVHPQVGVTVSRGSFTSANVTADAFWTAMRAWFERFPEQADAGTYSYFWVLSLGDDEFEFEMAPFFAVNHTLAEFETLMAPWYDLLAELGIEYTPTTEYYDNFHDAWKVGFPLEEIGIPTMMEGSRLFPRANWENATLFNQTLEALRTTITAGYPLLAFNMKAELQAGYRDDSANPAFRTMLMHAITSTEWDSNTTNAEIKEQMEEFTFDVLQAWRDVCPHSGAYMSEADILEPNFQQAFYGDHYDRLYALKKVYDPKGLFYAPTGVSSEDWVVDSADGLPDQNGRLCRKLE